MGANPTQAQAVVLCMAAFIAISAGLAANISYISVLAGLALLALSVGLFLKCKPWEQGEE